MCSLATEHHLNIFCLGVTLMVKLDNKWLFILWFTWILTIFLWHIVWCTAYWIGRAVLEEFLKSKQQNWQRVKNISWRWDYENCQQFCTREMRQGGSGCVCSSGTIFIICAYWIVGNFKDRLVLMFANNLRKNLRQVSVTSDKSLFEQENLNLLFVDFAFNKYSWAALCSHTFV